MKKKLTLILITILVIMLAFAWNYYVRYYKANSRKNDSVILIYRSTSYQGLLDSLNNSGVLKNFHSFKKAADKSGLEKCFKAGRYEIKEGLNNKEIVRIFANGWQVPANLVISGYIRGPEKLAAYLGKRLEADSTSFITALRDTLLLKEYGLNERTIISIIIPDTYELYWTVTPLEFLRRMKKEYDNFWNDERVKKAKETGLSKTEVSILASIVIEETKYVPEMPTIAGVYINRLKKGMLLQADPTVKYALNMVGITRILKAHLSIDSPYNTYRYKGLPPGPITIPPKEAIDAVLNYQKSNYIYFCARSTFDGQHSFASSYSDHLKNARAYQRAFTARQSAKQQNS